MTGGSVYCPTVQRAYSTNWISLLSWLDSCFKNFSTTGLPVSTIWFCCRRQSSAKRFLTLPSMILSRWAPFFVGSASSCSLIKWRVYHPKGETSPCNRLLTFQHFRGNTLHRQVMRFCCHLDLIFIWPLLDIRSPTTCMARRFNADERPSWATSIGGLLRAMTTPTLEPSWGKRPWRPIVHTTKNLLEWNPHEERPKWAHHIDSMHRRGVPCRECRDRNEMARGYWQLFEGRCSLLASPWCPGPSLEHSSLGLIFGRDRLDQLDLESESHWSSVPYCEWSQETLDYELQNLHRWW